MASKAVQMLCVVLGTIGLIGVIICCILPEWLVLHSSYPEPEYHFGLWMCCGQEQCRTYKSMDWIPSELHACRVMIVISCVLGILSLLFLFFGADFTRCVKKEASKAKMIQVAGVGLLLAGLLEIIPVSLVAHNNLRDNQCLSMDIGVSIYISWAAGVLMILTQGLLLSFGGSSSSGTARTSSRTGSSGGVTANSIIFTSSYRFNRVLV